MMSRRVDVGLALAACLLVPAGCNPPSKPFGTEQPQAGSSNAPSTPTTRTPSKGFDPSDAASNMGDLSEPTDATPHVSPRSQGPNNRNGNGKRGKGQLGQNKKPAQDKGGQDKFTPQRLDQLAKRIKGKNSQDKIAAIKALGRMGPSADKEIVRQPLLRALRNKNTEMADAAQECLKKIANTEATITGLYEAYDAGRGGRGRAKRVLKNIDSPAKSRVLLARMQSGDRKKLEAALYDLDNTKHVTAELMDHLISLLDHEDPWLRGLTVRAIGELGEAGAPATARILALMDTEESTLNELARMPYTLLAIAGREKTIATARKHLRSDKSFLRLRGLEAVAALGPDTVPELVSDVANLLVDTELSLTAGRVLSDMGPVAKPAIPQLIAVAGNTQPLDRKRRSGQRQAIKTLGELGPDATAAIGPLKAVLEKHQELLIDTLVALSAIMPPEQATPMILEYLDSDNRWDRFAAMVAIKDQLGTHAKGAIPKLMKLVDDKKSIDREVAIGALGTAGVDNEAVIDRIIEVSKERSEDATSAVDVLGTIKPVPPKVVAALIHGLHHHWDWIGQARCAEFLSEMPKAKEKVLPELIKAWKKETKGTDLGNSFERALLKMDSKTAASLGIESYE